MDNSNLRKQRLFSWVIAGCLQFVVLTVVAMFAYPGGTVADPKTTGYSFFHNFFSDLGRTETALGVPNTFAAILFFVALTLAGLGLVLFFLLMPSLLGRGRPAWLLSLLGTLFGILSGLSFVGVAATPANLFLEPHKILVQAAFLCFFAAVLAYIPAMLLARSNPRRYAGVFGLFALLLGAYVWLLFFGPGLDSPQGLVIQATGQKIIAYAAIVSILVQAAGARQVLRQPSQV